ncbi:MAG: ATP-binding protein, partial [Magnetococcales bacterium]|nr:ATP-binding protein [Magnetococcales bacterium]
KKFSIISNVQRFLAGVIDVEARGAAESCLMVVDGKPGLGKTRTMEWWAAQNGAVYQTASPGWSVCYMLREILKATDPSVKPGRSEEKLIEQLKEALVYRNKSMRAQGNIFGVVIDEAESVVRNKRLVETLRIDLSDELEIPFILVGMDGLRSDMAHTTPQGVSRVSRFVGFTPLTLEDAAQLVAELCEVEVREDLVAYLHKTTKGYIREMYNGLSRIESYGKKNPGSVGIKEMVGQPLFSDRNGKEVFVYGG